MRTTTNALLACLFMACFVVAGCAGTAGPTKATEADRYRCDNDVAFTVRFSGESAVVDSNRGYEVLYRTASGATSGQAAYSNPRLRAEFGLGTTTDQTILRYLLQPVVLRCVRE